MYNYLKMFGFFVGLALVVGCVAKFLGSLPSILNGYAAGAGIALSLIAACLVARDVGSWLRNARHCIAKVEAARALRIDWRGSGDSSYHTAVLDLLRRY